MINTLNKASFYILVKLWRKLGFKEFAAAFSAGKRKEEKGRKQGGQSCKTNHKCGEIVENQSTAKKCGVKFLENCLNPAHTGCFFTGPPLKS